MSSTLAFKRRAVAAASQRRKFQNEHEKQLENWILNRPPSHFFKPLQPNIQSSNEKVKQNLIHHHLSSVAGFSWAGGEGRNLSQTLAEHSFPLLAVTSPENFVLGTNLALGKVFILQNKLNCSLLEWILAPPHLLLCHVSFTGGDNYRRNRSGAGKEKKKKAQLAAKKLLFEQHLNFCTVEEFHRALKTLISGIEWRAVTETSNCIKHPRKSFALSLHPVSSFTGSRALLFSDFARMKIKLYTKVDEESLSSFPLKDFPKKKKKSKLERNRSQLWHKFYCQFTAEICTYLINIPVTPID